MLFLFAILCIVSFAHSSQSIARQFNDALIGRLEQSRTHFPFLHPARSTVNPFIYPKNEQFRQLQSVAADNKDDVGDALERFETFRLYLGRFLKANYRQISTLRSPRVKDQIQQETYSFTAFVISSNKLSEFVDTLPSEGAGSQEIETEDNNQSNERAELEFDVNFPRENVVDEIRNCRRENGNTGSNEFKVLRTGLTEFTRSRVNCAIVNSNIFVAVAMIHIVFRTTSLNDRVTVQSYADYELRRYVSKHFDYPYVHNRSADATTTTTKKTTTKVDSTLIPPRTSSKEVPRPGHDQIVEGTKVLTFTGGLKKGHQIVVRGMPTDDSHRFSVDLNSGDGNIALHISVRFDDSESKRIVVLNTMQKGIWEDEQREKNPFEKNVSFELNISCEDTGYEIKVNGQGFAFYRHRILSPLVKFVSVRDAVDHVTVADLLH